MDIVVKGRNVEVPEHFRTRVEDKLERAERYDSKIIRVDVELSHEPNRRQSKTCQRVQITLVSKGPAVRAEACDDTFISALDGAASKLESQLRKASDRRHKRERTPAVAVAATPDELLPPVQDTDDEAAEPADDGPGRIVRIKDHPGDPISVEEALYQMELVGHDFYLFNDVETGRSSVVYRRHGFDYGLLRLAPAAPDAALDGHDGAGSSSGTASGTAQSNGGYRGGSQAAPVGTGSGSEAAG
ncbi:ribosome-associated translation inhibitor RaiA [Nakamurella sp. DB0629]|uniref:Ribosome hibernation promoting factor n=1 Tax=Nakamurella aerolata TaxID=1656892 RepID=A0A849A6T4_9ACTN|nr:ribosome-associated translation inhibitor RaiA [Nakamurella aerolata]